LIEISKNYCDKNGVQFLTHPVYGLLDIDLDGRLFVAGVIFFVSVTLKDLYTKLHKAEIKAKIIELRSLYYL